MSPTVPRRQHAVKASRQPGSRTPAGDAFTALVLQVVRLSGRFTAAGEALARPAGQTLARWLVLEAIQDGPATVAQIARTMRLARQSVQRLADVLVRDGFAAYEDNPAHRRARLVRLTPAGRSALHRIQAAQRSWADAVGAELGEAELKEASDVLDRVLRAVRKPPGPPPPEAGGQDGGVLA
jgi:DNA-binding MarR family transcriptional regulator